MGHLFYLVPSRFHSIKELKNAILKPIKVLTKAEFLNI